ncbi:MAG: 4-phosphoerythronate dehydrogenase [Bacteroidales bacterium]|nr:4-phosphoerythronate dehydrogenase [Bacteroidales bacterium]
MKIVVDRDIPFIEGVLEPYMDVRYVEGAHISHNDLLDTEALMIRTRTKCNAALLDDTAVRIISTATIGTDHIDMAYCNEHGIYVQNAAGCNSGGVMNYVFSALYGVAARKAIDLRGMTFGIIGVGNVGSKVEGMARILGFNVLRCDPPRMENEGPKNFCSLDHLLANSDIVSLHVPLTDETRAMVNAGFLDRMKLGAILINSARGEVVVDEDLIDAAPRLGALIIDTWNHEPDVNLRLLDLTDVATPHIAGYSYQGKQNGTAAAVRSIARFYDIQPLFDFFPKNQIKELEAVKLDLVGKDQGQTTSVFQYNYPIFTDDFMFRINPSSFEELRNNYQYRREFYIDQPV